MIQTKENPAAGTSRAAQASTNQHSQYSEIDRARNALNAISPDVDRDTWVKIGMGAKAAGLDFEDWDQWSAGGQTYQPASAKSAWRSFRTDRGIGAGTLFWIAGEHGWREHVRPDFERRSQINPRDALRSINHEALTVVVLASEMKCNGTLDETTYQRLVAATARIGAALEATQ